MIVKKYPASEFIKMAMKEKGINAQELANYSNIPAKTISLILNNKTHFTIKMDYKISKILGFDVGILSNIEANYLNYLEEIKENKIYDFNFDYEKNYYFDTWNFRKHKIDKKKMILFLEKCEKSLKEHDIDYNKQEFELWFYNDFYKQINDTNDLDEIISTLSKHGVLIYYFSDSINIRGLSKNQGNVFHILINKNLNKKIDSFFFTLLHEIFHLFINKKNATNIEELCDESASNFLLNNHLTAIKEIPINLNNAKEIAKQLKIKPIFLEGFIKFQNNQYKNEGGDEINYENIKNIIKY